MCFPYFAILLREKCLMPDNQPSLNYRRELRKLIVKYFDKEKLRTMCFDLGVNFDNLHGDGIENNVISLISHFIKFGRLYELINYCIDELPEAINQFTAIQKTLEVDPTVLQEATALRAKDESTQSASTGLHSLVKLAEVPMARDELTEYQRDFEISLIKIEAVKHNKHMHDLFQNMELNYELVHDERNQKPEGKAAWNSMMINGRVLSTAIDKLLTVADQSAEPFYAEQQLDLLREGQRILQEAIQETDLNKLDAALQFLYQSLRQGLAVANRRLVDAAKELRLGSLVNALTSVRKRLEKQPNLNKGEFEQFSESIADLVEVDELLNNLVEIHNLWQAFYDELRFIEENVGRGDNFYELKIIWSGLQRTAEKLFGNNNDMWAVLLRAGASRLEEALFKNEPDPNEVVRLFYAYFNRATRQFRIVDDELLEFSQGLRKIGEPLESLLKIIDG